MAENRSEGRTVQIYDHRNPSEVLGGLILTKGVTNKNLYSMIRTVVTVHGDFDLRHNDDDTIIPDDDAPLQPGNYYIVTEARVEASNERPLHRSVSLSPATRDSGFRDAVRSRDGKCVLTGMAPRNPAAGIWRPLQAAHVFPLAYGEEWLRQGHGRWITNTPRGGESIHSVQNGLLLQASAHVLFDTYDFSINPDDHYKVVFFTPDPFNVAGTYIRQDFIDNPDRPPDELLRWHYRQAVLTNVKGAGEPDFGHDFPPGSDMIGDIFGGPMAGERMQFELFTRLAGFEEIGD